MCVFSPDDKHVLCSGVDTRIIQYDVPSWRQSPDCFPLREPVHRERYRRSTYLADAEHFVTAATEESHMHLMSVSGKKLGVVDFRGVVQNWSGDDSHGIATSGKQAKYSFMPRLGGALHAHLEAGRSSWLFRTSPFRGGPWQTGHLSEQVHGHRALAAQHEQHLTQGVIQLDDADPNGGSSRNNHEFVQSVRAHPLARNRIAVLLSLTQGETSYVALVDLKGR